MSNVQEEWVNVTKTICYRGKNVSVFALERRLINRDFFSCTIIVFSTAKQAQLEDLYSKGLVAQRNKWFLLTSSYYYYKCEHFIFLLQKAATCSLNSLN